MKTEKEIREKIQTLIIEKDWSSMLSGAVTSGRIDALRWVLEEQEEIGNEG